ncbi:type II toxin-antitoxin system RelE/ParE family toxin [Polynucleobacter rarus]|uniref:type II toxin-antitoxin system RelE/ParE family toxin n=1 Tax=Polynucleobacter rarus TaxID=556055 RepID=UPI000D3E154D|nr:type II toxin-antitoxin system RelE/ParE family toxin [Polynucleobacter rarus]
MRKELYFIGTALDDLRDLPIEARREAGYELDLVQCGYMPSDFKPMLNIGAGAYEIRIHVLGEWRVIYVAKFSSGVYVLHVFQKKTARTALADIEKAKSRYKRIQEKK